MKNIIFLVIVGLLVVGCGSLISIGDSNTNTLNNESKKDK
ncbi:Uncharacterised protein [Campylobacter hyointestinalis subsp. hyointestinalis]|uniref:Lipoprotein n=1 Tax=Campylobacter hyointestinalis subsp. hyointestinalis TaxID=91352 RepID=A0A9W5AWJ8_CAMHY|nr:Uncharacterised protein [Campylobacter hyointestinalis subsp. hyointestinalis]CUU91955.1 Uncharacterised protein [Campylobacter hyointestinalis subsp. hyointestinalis]